MHKHFAAIAGRLIGLTMVIVMELQRIALISWPRTTLPRLLCGFPTSPNMLHVLGNCAHMLLARPGGVKHVRRTPAEHHLHHDRRSRIRRPWMLRPEECEDTEYRSHGGRRHSIHRSLRRTHSMPTIASGLVAGATRRSYQTDWQSGEES